MQLKFAHNMPHVRTIFMTDIDKITKEFYGQYGLVMHTAQTIENGLHILLALWEFSERNISKIDYLKILAKPMTLGQLKNRMIENEIFDESASNELTKVNKIRRFLAHDFWWDRDIIFTDKDQLHSLHLELMSYLSTFEQLILIIDFRINLLRKSKQIYIEQEFGLLTVNDIRNFVNNLKE